MTNSWNNFNIKDTSLDPYIWFNEIYNFNFKFNNIKAEYEKDEDKLKARVFDILPEESSESVLQHKHCQGAI